MHILIVGGSTSTLGGVEAFCVRAREAFQRHRGSWRVANLPTDTAFLSVKGLPRFLRNLTALISYRHQKPDCIWIQYVTLPDLAFIPIAKLAGLSVMVTPHLGSNWRSQSNPLLRAISGWLLGMADRVALISESQKVEIFLPQHLPISNIRTFLPLTVLSAEGEFGKKYSATLKILHAARLSEGKGTFLLIEVCRRLRDDNVPFFANIAGFADDQTSAKLNALIAEHGLMDHIALLGLLSDEAMLARLEEADVLVHLSRIDSYPLIILEAMACSTFPIAIGLAGARNMVETYDGWAVGQDAAIAETVEFLESAPPKDIRLRGRAAAARVKADYGWEACVAAVEAAVVATIGDKAAKIVDSADG